MILNENKYYYKDEIFSFHSLRCSLKECHESVKHIMTILISNYFLFLLQNSFICFFFFNIVRGICTRDA